MRKILLSGLIAATVIPAAASAQDRHDQRQEQRHDQRKDERKDVRQNRQEIRRDVRQDVRRDVRQTVRHDVRQDVRRDIRHDRARVAYVAPYNGWRYRAVNPGFQLRPSFYGQRYYVGNYATYHLRAPGRFERWIRYGDDLVLVNTRNGRVIQVVRNRY